MSFHQQTGSKYVKMSTKQQAQITPENTYEDFNQIFQITTNSKYNDKSNSTCWRECDEEKAIHSHVFWTCKVLNGLWENSLKEINIISPLLAKTHNVYYWR